MSQMWKPFHSSAIVKDLVAEAGFEPAPFPVLSGATLPVGLLSLERDIGHDPIPTGWKPVVLPLHQSRWSRNRELKPNLNVGDVLCCHYTMSAWSGYPESNWNFAVPSGECGRNTLPGGAPSPN